MSELPDFISHLPNFDPQLPPPYKFKNVSARIFALQADKAKLRALCDKYLNDVAAAAGENITVKPIHSVVLLEVLTYGEMFSVFDDYENTGYSTQNEMCFAIPVALYSGKSAKDEGTLHSVGVFVPFVFVDNDWSQIAGREIVGFPKLRGKFQLPEDPAKLNSTKIDARVLDPFNKDTESEFRPLIEIQSGDAKLLNRAFGKPAWPFGPLELYDRNRDDAPFALSNEVFDKLKEAAGIAVNDYSLRQFREGKNPGKASYQSLLRSEMSLDSFKGAGTFSDVLITPHDYASLHLIDELGLTLDDSNRIVPEFSLLYEGDFGFNVAETMLTRCGNNVWTKHPNMDCSAVIGSGIKETQTLVKNQARVAKRVMKRMAKGQLNPERYMKDVESYGRNAMKYSKSMCKLAKASIRHLTS